MTQAKSCDTQTRVDNNITNGGGIRGWVDVGVQMRGRKLIDLLADELSPFPAAPGQHKQTVKLMVN